MGEEDGRLIDDVIVRMFDSMVRKDREAFESLMLKEGEMVHMTGTVQKRDVYLKGLVDGTFNYKDAKVVSIERTIDGDAAEAIVRTETTASVYGGGYHKWYLESKMELMRVDDKWMISRSTVSTC